MHVVGVVASDGVVGFDLTVPCQVFAAAWLADGTRGYDVRVCGPPDVRVTAVGVDCFRLRPEFGLAELSTVDTVVVPGAERYATAAPPWEVVDVVRRAARRGARIASVCTGAFVLAAAGLLDGQRATTHWRAAADLSRRYPDIAVDPSVLYVDNGQVLTSGGVAAGLDLCLHLVRRDHGAAVAARAARIVVMPPKRAGGQAQLTVHPDPAHRTDALQPILRWLQDNLHRPVTVTDIARRAGTSVRSINRRFREQAGTTPGQWLRRARLHRAQELLETTDVPVERIAALTGFGSAVALRQGFARQVGTTPRDYRRAFRVRGH